jgi:N-acetylglucosamine-6-phosphate deacetylase
MITGLHYKTNEAIHVYIKDGFISQISPAVMENDLPIIAPGLVDLQINGYGGKGFSGTQMNPEDILITTSRIHDEGVTTFFPTVTTYPEDMIKNALKTISKAVHLHPMVKKSVPGIHLEGPFITKEDGARGAHKKENVIAPNWELFQRWQDEAEGLIKIITLSPEWPEAVGFIQKTVRTGVKVSIGHTSASTEQIKAAVEAGATMSTHLGNGAHTMLPRHPNYIWDQLAEDRLWTCMIADGFHLPASFLKVVLQVKKEKAMLVSDAVYLSGMPPGDYITHKGLNVIKTKEGKLQLADDPDLLAGSAQMLMWGIEHLINQLSVPLPVAWDMASIIPSEFMNLPSAAGLSVGGPADMVLFRLHDRRLHIVETYKNGA